MLTERQLQLVKYLQECDGYTTAGKLAEVFHVSSRSIRNDLDAVQYYLKGLPVEIERTPRLGVRLIVKKGFDITSLYFSNEIKVYSREERVVIITVLLMISEKVTIEQLAEKLQVSKNTVVQDLRPAEEFLKKHEVRLIKKSYYGMSLKGDEEQIRNTLFNLYIKTVSEGSLNILPILKEYGAADPDEGMRMIRRVEAAMGIRFADESIGELESMILASLCRIRWGFHVRGGSLDDADGIYREAILSGLPGFQVTKGDLDYFVMPVSYTHLTLPTN